MVFSLVICIHVFIDTRIYIYIYIICMYVCMLLLLSLYDKNDNDKNDNNIVHRLDIHKDLDSLARFYSIKRRFDRNYLILGLPKSRLSVLAISL